MVPIKVEGVGYRYTEHWVLREVSFQLKPQEILGIIGPNGSGKTTLLRTLDGIIPALEGRVLIEGEDICRIKRRELAKLIAVVPQESPLIFPFRAAELVLMGRTPHLGRMEFESPKDMGIVREAMEMTDTWQFARRMIQSLSGGERQRVWIARALAQRTRIILLDESTAFLDIGHQATFFELLRKLNKSQGMTVVFVTHDINLAAQYGDRVMLLKDGRIFGIGTPEEVITEKNIREVYKTEALIDRNPVTARPRMTLGTVRPDKEAG